MEEEEEDGSRDALSEGTMSNAARREARSRGMKPGSMLVPPVTRIFDAMGARRSMGSWGERSECDRRSWSSTLVL